MNKRTPTGDTTGRDVVPVTTPEFPTASKPINKFKLFRTLTEMADELVERYEKLQDERRLLREWLSKGVKVQESWLGLGGFNDSDKHTLKRCEDLLALLDPEDEYYEDDIDDEGMHVGSRLKRDVIRNRLALLVGSKHIGSPTTPEVYTRQLLNYVADEDITYLELESACRELEGERKWLPDISEVLALVREHQERWSTRREAIRSIKTVARWLADEVKQFPAKAEEAYAEQCYRRSLNYLEIAKREAIQKQAAAAKAAQEVEAAMVALAKTDDHVSEAKIKLMVAQQQVEAAKAKDD
jgi:hypothetical protein